MLQIWLSLQIVLLCVVIAVIIIAFCLFKHVLVFALCDHDEETFISFQFLKDQNKSDHIKRQDLPNSIQQL